MSSQPNTYVLNLSEVPWSELGRDVHIEVSVCAATEKELQDPSLPPQFNEIQISGSVNGLLWFAREVVRVALSKEQGFHQHLDRATCAGHYHSDQDYWLTLALNERTPKAKDKSQSS